MSLQRPIRRSIAKRIFASHKKVKKMMKFNFLKLKRRRVTSFFDVFERKTTELVLSAGSLRPKGQLAGAIGPKARGLLVTPTGETCGVRPMGLELGATNE